jgi:basic amino acid/polyamine antiporter, APA family
MNREMPSKNRKGLRLFDVVIAGLSGAIGVEIFVLLNYAYFNLAGPAVLYALVFGGIINLLIMLSYSELSAALPLEGGEYTYIKKAYGGYVGFIFGCFRWLAAIFAASLAAVAFVLQLAFLSSAISPEMQTAVLNQSWIISIVIVAFMGLMEVRGSKKIGTFIVLAFILLFVGFIVGGFIHGLNDVNLLSAPLPLGTSGVFAAIVYVFPMFIGTKALVTTASGSQNPKKDIPRALIISAIVIIPLYLLLAFVAIGTVNPSETLQQIPILNIAANNIFGGYGGVIFAIAGMVACLSTLGTALSVQSSIARGMSRDGYFPKLLQSVHPRFGTFYVTAILGSVLVMVLSVLGAIPFLGYAASFGSLLVFALVNLSLMKLRKTQPYMERPFKTPLYPLLPVLGVILSLSMLVAPVLFGDGNALDALTSGLGLVAIVLGSYYLRMTGRFRVQIALGGVGIGTGISLLCLNLISLTGLAQPIIPFIPIYVQLFFSVILIVSGFFNFITHNYKSQDNESGHLGVAKSG